MVNRTFGFGTILRQAFHINVIVAGIHVEPIAGHVFSRCVLRRIFQSNRIEIVYVVECPAAKAISGNGGLCGIGIEHNLIEVNDIAALGIHLGRGTPNVIDVIHLAVAICIDLFFGHVDIGISSLHQIGIGSRICKTDPAVVSGILDGGELIAEQSTKRGHLDGVVIAAGARNVQHGTHVKYGIFGKPIMDYQELLHVGQIVPSGSLQGSHSRIPHGQQFRAIIMHVCHKSLGKHLYHLDHLGRGNLHIGIQVAKHLQGSHGIGFAVLAGPIIGGYTEVFGMISIEGAKNGIIIRNFSRSIILGIGGIKADNLYVTVFIQDRIAVFVHDDIGNGIAAFIQNGVAIRPNHDAKGIVIVHTDLHIGIVEVILHGFAFGQYRGFSHVTGHDFAILQVVVDVLSHRKICQFIFFGFGIIRNVDILATDRASEVQSRQLVVNVSQNAFRNGAILGVVKQTAVGNSLGGVIGYVSFGIQVFPFLAHTKLGGIILIFRPGIFNNTRSSSRKIFIYDGIT